MWPIVPLIAGRLFEVGTGPVGGFARFGGAPGGRVRGCPGDASGEGAAVAVACGDAPIVAGFATADAGPAFAVAVLPGDALGADFAVAPAFEVGADLAVAVDGFAAGALVDADCAAVGPDEAGVEPDGEIGADLEGAVDAVDALAEAVDAICAASARGDAAGADREYSVVAVEGVGPTSARDDDDGDAGADLEYADVAVDAALVDAGVGAASAWLRDDDVDTDFAFAVDLGAASGRDDDAGADFAFAVDLGAASA